MTDKLFYTVIVISLLIAIIILFFIISIVSYHRTYIRLQRERIHAEIIMQEMERKRIANDLHDSLGPLLSTVKLFIHSVTIANSEDKELLDKAGLYIDETITGLREISYNLLPNSLTRNGLIEALKEHIHRLNSRHILNIELSSNKNIALTKENEVHLFRIIQEIIHNTIKHSKASALKILITREGSNTVIVSKDDGVGFNVDEVKKQSGGLGIKSIESRCEILNASVKINSATGKGCTYIIKLPYNNGV